jgi:hypothetical protein
MDDSAGWRRYFEHNAGSLLDIPWDIGADLTPDEARTIASSLQEFQAGERSEGRHLYRAAQDYSRRTGDGDYLVAIRLFIAEEQRHARDLGRFLTLNGIPLVETTFADRVFRRLRVLLPTLEMSVAVLVTAEIIAKVYYAVLRESTQSVILRRLCDQILHDERGHVDFQCGQLRRVRANRSPAAAATTYALQQGLYAGTLLVVWWSHRRVIRRGGMTLAGWVVACQREFREAMRPRPAAAAVERASSVVGS